MAAPVGERPMRERIIDAAVRVIHERGVNGATTKEIARTAGVSEGSLYNHFDNKPALFGAAFGAVTAGIRDTMADVAGSVGQGTVEDNLTRLAAAAVRFYGELLPMTGPVLTDPEVLGWLRRTGRSAGPIQGIAGLTRYLQAEQRAGRLVEDAKPELLAASLLGACQQYAFLTLLADRSALADDAGLPADGDEYARHVVRALFAAHVTSREA